MIFSGPSFSQNAAYNRYRLIKGLMMGFAALVALTFALGLTSLVTGGRVHDAFALCVFALSALAVGALIGFLFGIPRSVRQPDSGGAEGQAASPAQPQADDRGQNAVISSNTNLEEVSDWLTKILVGVGLTQAAAFYGHFGDLTDALAQGFGNQARAVPLIGAVLILFCIIGFMAGYLLTYLILSREFAKVNQALAQGKLDQAFGLYSELEQLADEAETDIDAATTRRRGSRPRSFESDKAADDGAEATRSRGESAAPMGTDGSAEADGEGTAAMRTDRVGAIFAEAGQIAQSLPRPDGLAIQQRFSRSFLQRQRVPISAVKQALRKSRHYQGPIDEQFDDRFADAIKAFQRSQGLPDDGILGPDTFRPLTSLLPDRLRTARQRQLTLGYLRSRGESVSDIKRRLHRLGLYRGPEGASADADLIDAISAFQEREGLDVDGILGPRTYHRLVEETAAPEDDGKDPAGDTQPSDPQASNRS